VNQNRSAVGIIKHSQLTSDEHRDMPLVRRDTD